MLLLFPDKRNAVSPVTETNVSRDGTSADNTISSRLNPHMTSYPVSIKSDRESPKDPHNGYSSSFLTLTPPKALGDPMDKEGHYQHLSAHAQQLYSTNQGAGLNMGIVAT